MASPTRAPAPRTSAPTKVADPAMRTVALAATGIAAVSVLLALFVAWRLIEARRALDVELQKCTCCAVAAAPKEASRGR